MESRHPVTQETIYQVKFYAAGSACSANRQHAKVYIYVSIIKKD